MIVTKNILLGQQIVNLDVLKIKKIYFSTVESDNFTARLFDIYQIVYREGFTQVRSNTPILSEI